MHMIYTHVIHLIYDISLSVCDMCVSNVFYYYYYSNTREQWTFFYMSVLVLFFEMRPDCFRKKPQ